MALPHWRAGSIVLEERNKRVVRSCVVGILPLARLPKTPQSGSSQNTQKARFGGFTFCALGCIAPGWRS
jgi:hypothetical protein